MLEERGVVRAFFGRLKVWAFDVRAEERCAVGDRPRFEKGKDLDMFVRIG